MRKVRCVRCGEAIISTLDGAEVWCRRCDLWSRAGDWEARVSEMKQKGRGRAVHDLAAPRLDRKHKL